MNNEFKDPTCFHHGRIWEDDLIVVPIHKTDEVIAQHHDALTAGHWGLSKTYNVIARKFTFPRMRDWIKLHVATCDICQHVKAEKQRARGLLQPILIPQRRWQSVHIDWIVGLPPQQTQRGLCDCVLTFIDRATKMVHFQATSKRENMADTVEHFMNHVVRLHGIPRSIVCDRAAIFLGSFWQATMDRLGIKIRMTSGFHLRLTARPSVPTRR